MNSRNPTVCIDFDGTCVKHIYPYIGEDVPYAVNVMKKLIKNNVNIILFTMRSGKELDEAVKWFEIRNIPLYGINKNPTQTMWTKSPKAYANAYVDDAAIGCPTRWDIDNEPPYVDWTKVEQLLIKGGLLPK